MLRFLVTIASLGWLALATVEARAGQLLVVASTAPNVTVGSLIDGDRELRLAEDMAVTVLSRSGKATTLSGPFDGRPGSGVDGGEPGLLIELSKLLTAPVEDDTVIGSARARDAREPTDPWVIDVGRSGDHCVRGDGRPELWRASADEAATLSLKLRAPRTRVILEWPRGEDRVGWPAEVPVTGGAVYSARFKGSNTAALLRLRVVPDGLPSDAHLAAWMAEAGCDEQARRLLVGLR